jgi:hypothetical protein
VTLRVVRNGAQLILEALPSLLGVFPRPVVVSLPPESLCEGDRPAGPVVVERGGSQAHQDLELLVVQHPAEIPEGGQVRDELGRLGVPGGRREGGAGAGQVALSEECHRAAFDQRQMIRRESQAGVGRLPGLRKAPQKQQCPREIAVDSGGPRIQALRLPKLRQRRLELAERSIDRRRVAHQVRISRGDASCLLDLGPRRPQIAPNIPLVFAHREVRVRSGRRERKRLLRGPASALGELGQR